MKRLKILGLAALLAAGPVICPAAQADTDSTPAKVVTDQEVRNYAGAMAALQQMNMVVAAQLAAATPAERTTIEQRANTDRQTILDRYSLDPASFNAISKAVEADPVLGDRVRKVMMDSVLGS